MRVSDVFQLHWTDIQDGRLHYMMGKNGKLVFSKIHDKANNIISKYEQFRENRDDYIFPKLKGCDPGNKFILQRTIAFKTSAIDKVLRIYVAPAAGDQKETDNAHSKAQFCTECYGY